MKTPTYSQLSPAQSRLLSYVRTNNLLRTADYRDIIQQQAGFMFQPLPIFLEPALGASLGSLTRGLFELIKQIPSRIFNLRAADIGAYYSIPEKLAAQQLKHFDVGTLDNLLGRADVCLTPTGFKCMEFNISSNLGNMLEIHQARRRYVEHACLKEYFQAQEATFAPNILDQYFDFIAAQCSKISDDDTFHVVFACPAPAESFVSALRDMGLRGSQGHRFTFNACSYYDLEIRDRKIFHRGKRIHALVDRYEGLMPDQLAALGRSGSVVLFGGNLTTLLQNKISLALLSELSDSHLFTDAERALIDRFVPWTRKLTKERLTPGNYFLEFLMDEKDSLILKQSNLSSGESVHIGKECPIERWQAVLHQAGTDANWLVQTFADSIRYEFLDDNDGLSDYMGRWGAYVFGDKMGYKDLILKPMDQNESVVNVHHGARYTYVFEMLEEHSHIREQQQIA
ncbi:hypothetical protein SAMN04488109_6890 [Chryseolinea serpens]|uniref:Uncharacterized protein n=1 Tax=Chryseolinea serpens TaxID=947013 RepID=A0A1M5XV76_9BACT|nr:hypothetical protein [Chryseolinea serpens]SHI03438.1 hypothetical protein SAMN04488109_6890 [Chryseolinea serpens]